MYFRKDTSYSQKFVFIYNHRIYTKWPMVWDPLQSDKILKSLKRNYMLPRVSALFPPKDSYVILCPPVIYSFLLLFFSLLSSLFSFLLFLWFHDVLIPIHTIIIIIIRSNTSMSSSPSSSPSPSLSSRRQHHCLHAVTIRYQLIKLFFVLFNFIIIR